jgi:hypothetical protein
MNASRFVFWFAVAAAVLPAPLRGAGFSLSPSVVTNDVATQISLNITGLVAGSTVRFEKYMDLNANGVIDSSDLMVQAFSVTDGQAVRIGGVRNSSVPADEDGLADGQLHVLLNYPSVSPTLERIAGQYLFRLVDPLGGFPPITNAFTVVQKTYTQGVTGRIYNASGQPLANCVVVYLVDNGGGAGAMSDDSGNFTLYTPPGDFFTLAIKAGTIGDQSSGGITVQSNLFATKNLTNVAAAVTVSGRATDIASGVGLPGLFVQAESEDGLFALSFADVSGNYSISVLPGLWKVKLSSDSGLPLLGYVQIDSKINVDTSSGSVSNINFQFAKASALIYGTILDNFSNPVPALNIVAQDSSYTYEQSALTDVAGHYSMGVFAGDWFVRPENSDAVARGLLGDGRFVTVTNTGAARQDLVLHRVTAHVRGRVISASGVPLGNIGVDAGPDYGSNSSSAIYIQAADDGTFDLGLFGGRWNIAIECSSATDRAVAGPNIVLDLVDGIDRNNLVLVAQPANYLLTVAAQDKNGSPVTASAYASITLNGTNYNACSSSDNSGNQQIAVFPGVWQTGLSGDFTSRNYDNPRNQTVHVPGDNLNLTFTLYPRGQTPPMLLLSTFNGGHFQFTLNGAADAKYRIEYTTSLTPPINWVPVRTNTAFGGTFQFDDFGSGPTGGRFYRTSLVP